MYPKKIYNALTGKEQIAIIVALAILVVSGISSTSLAVHDGSALVPVAGGIYREGVVGQPVAINPITSSNPADLDISSLIYSRLEDIITNHTIEKNGKVHIVKIAEGLTWENGRSLTSDDIVFTIRTIQSPDARSPLFKNWEGVVVDRISELQIEFTLPSPYAFFQENINALPIIPEHIFGTIPPANLKLSDYNLEPIGSGPYKIEKRTKQKNGFIKEIRLTRNEKYHKKPAFIEQISLIFFETEEDAINAFRRRSIDAFGSSALSKDLLKKTDRRGVTQSIIPMPRYYAIFLNENINPLLESKTVRKALRDSIDKRNLISAIFPQNTAHPAESPLQITNAPEPLSNEDIEEALKGASLNLIVPEVSFLEETAKIIASAWKKVGAEEVNIITLPPEDLLENVIKSNNYEMVLFGNILDFPEDIFPFWHSGERFYPGLNLSLYKDSRADTLMEQARQTGDRAERLLLIEELDETIQSDVPAVFLYSLPYVYIHRDILKGLNTETPISTPADRFRNISEWHTKTARVLEDK